MQLPVLADDGTPQTLGGHALLSADGRHLVTRETHPETGAGWIGVRLPHTLRRLGAFRSRGLDPHQMLLDEEGRLWVANGGIPRLADGRQTALERMAPSLVCLASETGELLAEHRLDDPRLSLRPSPGPRATRRAWAWRCRPSTMTTRGAAKRPCSPCWKAAAWRCPRTTHRVRVMPVTSRPARGGGFVLSGQKVGRGLWWHPGAAARLTRVAELGEPCALASWDSGRGVLIAPRLGVARRHASDAPRMLRWPASMSADNHGLLLG